MDVDTIFSLQEVADRLKVKPNTIRKYVREGKLISTRLGAKVQFNGKDVQAFIESGRVTNA
jgi:excisionase family DNA binding protein